MLQISYNDSMKRRDFMLLPASSAADPDNFILTWNEFVKVLGEWDEAFRTQGIWDKKKWDEADRLWQKMHGRKWKA